MWALGDRIRGRALEFSIACIVLAYALLAIFGSAAYPFEARLYPVAVGILTVPVACVFIVQLLKPPSPVVEAVDAEVPTPDAAPDADAKVPSALMIFGGTLGGLVLLLVFGVYVFAFVFTLVFSRFVAKVNWKPALGLALGLTIFTYLLIGLIVGEDPWEFGILSQ